MKLRELNEHVQYALSNLKEDEDLEVVIPDNSKDSIGRMASKKVIHAAKGFDWDSGLFIIST